MFNDDVDTKETVVLVLETPEGRITKTIVWDNLVTDAGDRYYAELAVIGFQGSGSPTNSFQYLELGTAGNTPTKSSDRSDVTSKVSSSIKVVSSGYPTTNDTDTLNTGAGVDIISWKFEYGTAEANASGIDRCIITNGPSPGASEAVLNYGDSFTGGSFTKTSNDLLTVYVNHRLNGV